MGRVLHLGSSFMWAELAWAELVLVRVVLHPCAIMQLILEVTDKIQYYIPHKAYYQFLREIPIW